MRLYSASPASGVFVVDVVLTVGEAATESPGLPAGSAGIIVNEMHNIPMTTGNKKFLTEGTVFLRVSSRQVLTAAGF